MRKKDPNGVVDDYVSLVEESEEIWADTVEALASERLRKQASLDAFLRCAVGWETFLSDWYIAAINRSPHQFVNAMRDSCVKQVPPTWSPRIEFGFGDHPTVDHVISALDAGGRNVTFKDGDELKKRAKADLTDPYLSKVQSINVRDLRVIEAVKATRDCLGHRSTASVRTLNERLDALSTAETQLRKGGASTLRLTGIGKYLYGRRSVNGERRIVAYHHRLSGICEKLRVP